MYSFFPVSKSKMARQEIAAPEWITTSYIEESMQKSLNLPELKIHKCDISYATAVGDNYGSILLRARLLLQKSNNSQQENFVFVMKIPPAFNADFFEQLMKDQQVKDIQTFPREIKMYTKTLPASNALLLKVFPNHEKFYAECYFHEVRSNQIACLALEDLHQSGFKMADRVKGLDLDHTTLVLQSLAKFHASSLILLDNDPETLDLHDMYAWADDNRFIVTNMYVKPFGCVADSVLTWEDEPKKDEYYRKLKALEAVAADKLIKNYERDDAKFNVLCHGDCWVNNMMFRYDADNKVNGIKFVDYQLTNYNTPAIDLVYFILTSTQSRFENVESLLKIYYETFMETVNKLNYKLKKPFTLEILKSEFESKLFYGLATILSILPITMADQSEAPKLDDLIGEDKSAEKGKIYRGKEFTKILKVALPYFEKHGVL